MTTTTTARPAPALPQPTGRAGLAGVIRSEFVKIRSTRSTYWTLLIMFAVSVGFGVLACIATVSSSDGGPGFDATNHSLGGLYLGQLIIAVLGTLAVTSEYATGMIRTSLTVMPRRGVLVTAKALVFAAVALVTGLVTSFTSFFIGQAILASKHFDATLGQPHVLRAVIGGALFLAVCGMLSFGLGLILRHTAAAITASIGVLFVLSVLVNFLPDRWQDHVDKWMPALAGAQIWTTQPTGDNPPLFSPWAGFAVLAGYTAVVMAAGVVLFLRRDA
jgi:ABC-2 type transport system permease protein